MVALLLRLICSIFPHKILIKGMHFSSKIIAPSQITHATGDQNGDVLGRGAQALVRNVLEQGMEGGGLVRCLLGRRQRSGLFRRDFGRGV